MDMSISQADQAYRLQLIAWCNENLPPEFAEPDYMPPEDWNIQAKIFREVQHKLFAVGYAGVHLPKAFFEKRKADFKGR